MVVFEAGPSTPTVPKSPNLLHIVGVGGEFTELHDRQPGLSTDFGTRTRRSWVQVLWDFQVSPEPCGIFHP